MSRTYRRSMLQLDCGCSSPIRLHWSWKKGKITKSIEPTLRWANSRGVPPDRECECEIRYDYYSKRNWKRDRKNWWKPGTEFKEVSKRSFKAKVRHEMDNRRYDCMPVLKKTDVWDYN